MLLTCCHILTCTLMIRSIARLCSVGYKTIPGYFSRILLVPIPELLYVLLDIHTHTRNFCKFCTPVAQYPGYGYVRVELPVYGCGYNIHIHTRNFCELCMTCIPPLVPGTSVSSVRLPYVPVPGAPVSEKAVFCRVRTEPCPGYYTYPELLQVLYDKLYPYPELL